MHQQNTGPQRAIKKYPHWVKVGLALVYLYSLCLMLMHVGLKSFSGQSSSDIPIIAIAIIGGIVALLYGKWAVRMARGRMRDEEARQERVRKYGRW